MNTCAECQTPLPADAAFCPDCGTRRFREAEPLQTLGALSTLGEEDSGQAELLAPGTTFAGRYEIAATLGAGGMGVVYAAHDKVTEREVALKVIRPDRIGGAHEVQRLIDEGVTARDIRHPNIVAVYDVGECDGRPYLSMECCKGDSLREWHRAQRAAGVTIDFRVARRIVLELLQGLGAAHAAGVIHRDLKPENVILLAEPTRDAAPLKILDFGIARAVGSARGTGSGTGLGTPHYMAPEQITSPDLAGPPADLYSLSVVFYELLAGVLPQGHWQPPSTGRAGVPDGIDALVESGLANRPENRPQDARQYTAELEAASTGSDRPRVGAGLFEKHKKLWIAGGIFFAVAVMGGFADDGEEPWQEDEPQPMHEEVAVRLEDVAKVDVPIEKRMNKPKKRKIPEGPAVEDLSGVWYDGYGGAFAVHVSRTGSVTADGMSLDGFAIRMTGRIRDRAFTYKIKSATGQTLAEGSGSWDGGQHVAFQTRTLEGFVNLEGVFHVNHEHAWGF
ncbi:MAG: protein kinase [bacterium]|nr:protein kinase [bacterium]